MSEILTESFCERCGTRYTFEPVRPKTRLKRAKVLSLGLKNFVLSDETTMDEAMAAARSEADREVTSEQLDAFHKTFNFCMSCRQYTCPNCWNEAEERCLSCAPVLAPEPIQSPFPGLAAIGGIPTLSRAPATGTNGHIHDEPAIAAVAAVEIEGARAPEMIGEVMIAGPAAAPQEIAPEPVTAEAIAAAEPAGVTPVEKAISQTSDLLRRFRPGESLDDELAAYERQRTSAEPVAEIAMAAAVLAPEPDVVPESELAAAEPEPTPERLVAAAAAAAVAADVVEQPTWQITAPDPTPTTPPPAPPEVRTPLRSPIPTAPTAQTNWPAKPEWPGATSVANAPFPPFPRTAPGGVEALWAASNQEIAAAPPLPGRASSIQPCVSCGLSLSATARFCRRCGTLQGG